MDSASSVIGASSDDPPFGSNFPWAPSPQPTYYTEGHPYYYQIFYSIIILCCSGGFFFSVGYAIFRGVHPIAPKPLDPGVLLIASIPVCPYERTAAARRVAGGTGAIHTAATADEKYTEQLPDAVDAVGAVLPSLHSRSEEGTSSVESGLEPCAVCLCGLGSSGDAEPCKELRCGHCYHSDCLDGWLMRSGVCPLCKRRVEPAQGPGGQVKNQHTPRFLRVAFRGRLGGGGGSDGVRSSNSSRNRSSSDGDRGGVVSEDSREVTGIVALSGEETPPVVELTAL